MNMYLIQLALSYQKYLFGLVWRSRANCYFCFNQRLYELIGLLEYYPELFAEAESYEYKGGGETPYYWKQDYPMKKVRENAEKIKRKRVKEIIKQIAPQFQYELFDDSINEEFFDILSIKSCGLFCGK